MSDRKDQSVYVVSNVRYIDDYSTPPTHAVAAFSTAEKASAFIVILEALRDAVDATTITDADPNYVTASAAWRKLDPRAVTYMPESTSYCVDMLGLDC